MLRRFPPAELLLRRLPQAWLVESWNFLCLHCVLQACRNLGTRHDGIRHEYAMEYAMMELLASSRLSVGPQKSKEALGLSRLTPVCNSDG